MGKRRNIPEALRMPPFLSIGTGHGASGVGRAPSSCARPGGTDGRGYRGGVLPGPRSYSGETNPAWMPGILVQSGWKLGSRTKEAGSN